jgi:hypothetical protein
MDEHTSRGRFAGHRDAFLRDLEKLGPSTTPVRVNDRPLSLEAALRLLEQLPDETELERQGGRITVRPDPFALPLPLTRGSADSKALTERLIARQDETDRLAEAERRRARPWWRRWLG